MNRLLLCCGMTVVLGAAISCSDDGGNVIPSETDPCPVSGATTCGLSQAGQQAVLSCAAAPQEWSVQDYCLGDCVFDPVAGAICENRLDQDSSSQDVEIPPDVVDQDMVDSAGDKIRDDDVTIPPDDVQPDQDDPEDVIFPDLMPDMTPPWIESTTPADGDMDVALPFVVTLTFTETMHAPTIVPQTIHVTDVAGKEVTLLIEFVDDDNRVVQLVPESAVFHSAPYTVTLDSVIKDLAGNMMGNTYQFTFYTESIKSLSTYHELAGKFAPDLYQETDPSTPEFDYFTGVNFDGDWVAENNVEAIQTAQSVTPKVYYSVMETKSHFFITYMFFYPYRNAETESNRFGNDVSGVQVIVRKEDEQPVALETYFKPSSGDERSFSYLTEEAGLIPGGKTYTDLKFDGLYPCQTLFPDNRYLGYLSSRKHESCLWLHEYNSFLDGCQLNSGIKNSMQKIAYRYNGGAVTPLEKEGGSFPSAQEDVFYSLEHLLAGLWPRRGDLGPGLLWAAGFSYTSHTSTIFPNRPSMSNKIPSSFIDPIGNDDGRPPWAWRHYPGNGSSFYQMPRGVFFLDPAVHFKQRHDQSDQWNDWDAGSGTGWSLEYCFNPYFGLDFRGVWPECTEKK